MSEAEMISTAGAMASVCHCGNVPVISAAQVSLDVRGDTLNAKTSELDALDGGDGDEMVSRLGLCLRTAVDVGDDE
jgi:hypothetical protein